MVSLSTSTLKYSSNNTYSLFWRAESLQFVYRGYSAFSNSRKAKGGDHCSEQLQLVRLCNGDGALSVGWNSLSISFRVQMVRNCVMSLWKRPYHYGCPLRSLCPGPYTSMQQTTGEPINGVLRNPVLPQICRPIPFLVKTGHTHHRHFTCVCVHISNLKSHPLLMLTRASTAGNRMNGEKWNTLLPPAIRTFRTVFPASVRTLKCLVLWCFSDRAS